MTLRAIAFCLLLSLPLTMWAAPWYGDPQFPEGTPWSIQVLSSDASGSRLVLECPGFWAQPVQQNGETYTQVILPQAGLLSEIGLPELPAICRLLAIPDDRDAQLVIKDVSYLSFSCDAPYLVEPSETTQPVIGYQPGIEGIYPAEWAQVEQPGIFKDYRIAPVIFHPVRYDSDSNELLLATRLEVEVQTLQPSSVNVKTIHKRTSDAFLPLYEALIDNLGEFNTATPLVSESPRGKYLIFIDEDFQSNYFLDLFVEWKRQLGYQVTIMPISSESVSKEEIKASINDEYTSGDLPLDYVLLIGDISGSLMIPAYTKVKPGGSGEQDVTDHTYTLIEGDDYFPDVLIGRISVNSEIELATVLNKTITYQRDPLLYGSAWLKKALVVAGNYSDVGIAPITPVWTSLWLVDKLYDYGYTQVDTVFYWEPSPTYPGTPEIAQSINNGVGLVAYRGWADANGWQYPVFGVSDIQNLNNGSQLPIMVSIVCNTGDFGNAVINPCFGEAWIRAGTPADIKGGVAFFGPSDLHTNTKWNNALYAGFFEGLLEENLYRIGQSAVRSKMELYYGFPENTGLGDFAEFYFHVYNILGDPELSIWTDIPSEITLEMPDQLTPGRQLVTATARKSDGSPLGGAYIAFYKDGEILAGGVTFSDGTVEVEIEPLTEGAIVVTASKQNYLVRQDTLSVQVGEFPLGISDLSVGGNGIALAAETVDLTVTLHNYGATSFTGIEAELTATDPYVESLPLPVSVGSISAAGDAEVSLPFALSANCPDGHAVEFTLILTDDASHSADLKFLIPVGGYQFLPAGYFTESGDLEPGSSAQIRVLLMNAGTLLNQPTGVLSCADGAVTITANEATFPVLQPGTVGMSSSAYSVEVSPAAAVGRQVIFDLEVSFWNDYSQTVSFPAQLGQPASTDPLGPDSYGYYVYDDTDEEYAEAPVYSWIELDPNYGGSGADHHPLSDDASVIVNLPFTFRYYGIDYDTLTICSNGWVSMGETWMANFRNWNLPSGLGPPALIAPFWDDLKADTTGGNSAIHVYSRYDGAQGRFIVEWSRTINRYGYENYSTWKEETFELILFDTDQYPTATGDGEILFQYHTINDVDYNNNYATVGIEDEDHLRGLQYAYSNDYPTTAAPLAAGRALKFTTDPPDSFDGSGTGSPGSCHQVELYAPVPNPANPVSVLSFALPREGYLLLELYDTLGRRVLSLFDGRIGAGKHSVEITGDELASGIYFAHLRFEGTALTQKVLILK